MVFPIRRSDPHSVNSTTAKVMPLPDSTGSRNEPIRQKVLSLLNATSAYRQLFGDVFPEVKAGAPIDFFIFGKAIAEFEFTQVFANAPIDQFLQEEITTR
jgi:cytochrome c peroxidase